jgi:DNA-binding GntR family transcriptional regulator
MVRQAEGGAPPRPRSVDIYEELRARICTNRVAPGEVLHEERLAREFSVSRSPVRRALAKLEHDGLVEIRHGVGTRVTWIDRNELAEVYELRMILAMQSGHYLKTPFDDAFIDGLRGWRRGFEALSPEDVQGFADVNVGYYTDLTGRTQNRYLREMQLGLFFQTSRMWLIMLPLMQWKPIISAVCGEIDELIRVAEDQDPVGFGLVTRNHIFMSRRRLFEAEETKAEPGS